MRYSNTCHLECGQGDGNVSIALEYDGRLTAAKSARAPDHDRGTTQRDYCLLDLKIYFEAKRFRIRWLKEDLHAPLSK